MTYRSPRHLVTWSHARAYIRIHRKRVPTCADIIWDACRFFARRVVELILSPPHPVPPYKCTVGRTASRPRCRNEHEERRRRSRWRGSLRARRSRPRRDVAVYRESVERRAHSKFKRRWLPRAVWVRVRRHRARTPTRYYYCFARRATAVRVGRIAFCSSSAQSGGGAWRVRVPGELSYTSTRNMRVGAMSLGRPPSASPPVADENRTRTNALTADGSVRAIYDHVVPKDLQGAKSEFDFFSFINRSRKKNWKIKIWNRRHSIALYSEDLKT